MGADSNIEWCDHTHNHWRGCTAISPACDYCYAKPLVEGRLGGDFSQRVLAAESTRKMPLAWNRKAEKLGVRYRVFCASIADVFDNQVPEEWRADLWALIRATPHLDWLLLTKRPQNIIKMLPPDWGDGYLNVWLGTTAENQAEAERRIPHLLRVKARVRFLSCEPLLGAVRLSPFLSCTGMPDCVVCDHHGAHIDWVICGGESGPGARPMHPDWARSLRDQCVAAGVPFFFKQWGEYLPVGQELPGCGKVHGATGVTPGRMKLHYGGTRTKKPQHAFAQRGVGFQSLHDGKLTFRIGKKAAGRLLDDSTWDQFPKVGAA